MKKITLLTLFLIPLIGFSQSNNEKIQSYLNANYAKLGLTNSDISDWTIESEGSSNSTKINTVYVKQRYKGTEIFESLTNFWIKNDEVTVANSRFVNNISEKANAITPTLSVLDALTKTINSLQISNSGSFQIIETKSPKEFKISNGILTDNPITAKLVYKLTKENTLKLAWDFTIDTPGFQHTWSVRIDAFDGKILDKHDMVLSCNFEPKSKQEASNSNLFTKTFLKENTTLAPMGTLGGNYRVVPFNYISPDHYPGGRALISNPEDALASPQGWHNSNAIGGTTPTLIYTITRGNNAWAKDDYNGTNASTGVSADGGASLTFDFPYPGTGVAADTYINAATTNVFYMNNIMHDVFYQYGFNEVNGNFQINNYGKGGSGNDAVKVDAQDGSKAATQSLNNANFSTPTDGGAGRMQMFLWNVAPPTSFVVNSPAGLGPYDVTDNGFTPGHVSFPNPGLTSDFVLYDDGTPDNSDACSAAVNAAALNGKIAVIRRGTCTFVLKVKAAQDAGAIGAIIVNNVDGGISMGGNATSNGITIPAISMTLDDGEALIAAMASGTVNGTITGPGGTFVNTDGDFDNGVISHEYGHGISTRLAGGPGNSSCLQSSEQEGEGWSDFFALMLQIKPGDTRNDARGIGTFVESQPTNGPGIRQYRYSTDMSVNPHTFAATNDMWYNTGATGNPPNTDVIDSHAVGSVWAVMLWDLAWAYIDKYGYDPNIYTGTGGNNKVLQLVLDGIKLQPCGPSFVESRDAIIAADQATTGGKDYCLIWDVFARRGLGLSADSGSNAGDVGGIQDQVEAFDIPAPGPNCTLAVNYFENNDMIKVYPNPSKGQVNIRINQFVGKINLQVVDINGRVVYNAKNNDFNIEKTIDLSGLQSGMYVLKIVGSELNYSQKIILN